MKRIRAKNGKFAVENKFVTKKCHKCSAKFECYESHNRKFCSRVCYTQNKRKDLSRKCEICNTVFDQRNKNGRYKLRKFCTKKCFSLFMAKIKIGGKNPHSVEWRKKVSEAQLGSKSHLWEGGKTPLHKKIRHSLQSKLWREEVFKRDDYTCQICLKRGGILNADHIKPFAYHPELRFELSNGRTLCISCHKKTDTYGMKAKKAYRKWLLSESVPSKPY